MNVLGIIFSNIHDENVADLTRQRTMASVPFGCRYRLIDFALSNMVNSGINRVGVITHYNYQSLMDHIGSGKDWDLARRSGGIQILPPYITAFASSRPELYTTRLEALMGITSFIQAAKEEYVVLSDRDVICNMDFNAMIRYHIESGADCTIATKQAYLVTKSGTSNNVALSYDENCDVTDIYEHNSVNPCYCNVNLNMYVMNRKYLEEIALDGSAHGYKSFTKDVLARRIGRDKIKAFKCDGYFATVDSMADYFACSMDLLNSGTRRELFGVKDRPIFTKVRNSAPTHYSETAVTKNSLIADGCVIEGTVENCILFRGVKIGRGTTVRNSILMQDTVVGDNVYLNCVITDKSAVVRDGRVLSGHESKPYFIEKNLTV
ncbi:MAG: glucose-1-phosphate adenylyltransferase subunit GlgD [Clostridia bacterium]|nr:glucose-1-phosphate adenylyltransferase subunit GlgD [Clostridia bacterium]